MKLINAASAGYKSAPKTVAVVKKKLNFKELALRKKLAR
jgi:hypothetical protein